MFHDEETPQIDTLDGLTAFLTRPRHAFQLPGPEEYRSLSPARKTAFNESRLDRLSAEVIVNTPQVQSVVKNVRRTMIMNRGRVTGRSGVLISGDARMGKTTAAIATMRYVYEQYATRYPDWQRRSRVPIVYIDVPPESSGRAMMGRFADFLQIPVRRSDTTETIKRSVVPLLNTAGTQLIVVDEFHNLADNTRRTGESADVLKSVSNQVAATFVVIGVNIHTGPILSGDRGRQIAGRFSKEVLVPYTTANSEERKLWNGLICAFESQLCLFGQSPKDLLRHSEYLHDRTGGRISALGHILVQAAQLLVMDGLPPQEEQITRALLAECKVDGASEDEFDAVTEALRAEGRGHAA